MSKRKPTLPVRTPTEREYRTTQNYLKQWQESSYACFANFLLSQKMAQATRIKHLRQAGTLQKRGADFKGKLLGTLSADVKKPPLVFTDDDFVNLHEAFIGIDYPKFIQPEERHRYWQCILHFAAITALRREAILGLKITDVNLPELFINVPPGIDKKDTQRFKAITPELADELLNLPRGHHQSLL